MEWKFPLKISKSDKPPLSYYIFNFRQPVLIIRVNLHSHSLIFNMIILRNYLLEVRIILQTPVIFLISGHYLPMLHIFRKLPICYNHSCFQELVFYILHEINKSQRLGIKIINKGEKNDNLKKPQWKRRTNKYNHRCGKWDYDLQSYKWIKTHEIDKW